MAFSSNNPTLKATIPSFSAMVALESEMNYSKLDWLMASSAFNLPIESIKLFLISLNLAMTALRAEESVNSYLLATSTKAFKKDPSIELSF